LGLPHIYLRFTQVDGEFFIFMKLSFIVFLL
jgi:hypothetical protein